MLSASPTQCSATGMCGRPEPVERIPRVLAAIQPADRPAKITTKKTRTKPVECHCQNDVAARKVPPMNASVASHHPTGSGGLVSVSGLSM